MKLIPQANRDPENISKQLLKSQTSFIICLHFGNFTRRTFPFYTSEIHTNNIFFFYNGLPTLIPGSHFYFLYLIYFQTVFSVFSSSSDASTYIQIENPSLI